jgi:hypothetical protein
MLYILMLDGLIRLLGKPNLEIDNRFSLPILFNEFGIIKLI